MHALRRLITEEMDKRGWRPVDLVRASDLSPQLISNLLSDDREYIDAMPKRDTLRRLAWAFRVDDTVLYRAAASAFGVPMGSVEAPRAEEISDEVLIAELARRLGIKATAARRLTVAALQGPGKAEKRR